MNKGINVIRYGLNKFLFMFHHEKGDGITFPFQTALTADPGYCAFDAGHW